ncbi:MAG TPA: hypothetical protein VF175_14125 [Lacipirellula sp.]
MPRPSFTNDYTGESVSPDQYANGLGDPFGNSTLDDELRYFQSYLNAHPDWQGNEFVGVRNGKVYDKRGFLDRHSGLIAGIGAAALPAAVLGGPALAGLFSGGGGSAPLASTPFAGSGALPGTLASTPFAGAAALPAASGFSAVAAPAVAGSTAAATTAGSAGGGAGAAGAAGGGAGILGKLGLGWEDLVPLAVPAIGALSGPPDRSLPNQDALDELIRLQTQRVKDADPLYQTVLRMAMALAPTGARG